jgi:hypothetical protein
MEIIELDEDQIEPGTSASMPIIVDDMANTTIIIADEDVPMADAPSITLPSSSTALLLFNSTKSKSITYGSYFESQTKRPIYQSINCRTILPESEKFRGNMRRHQYQVSSIF